MIYRNPLHWRLRVPRYCLVGTVCPHCNQISFPPGRPCCQPRLVASASLELVWPANILTLEELSLKDTASISTSL